MTFRRWLLLPLGLLVAFPAGAAQLPPATLALPGLYAPGLEPAARELYDQQLAATLEGQGFTVLDSEALAARDIEVHPDGCFSPLPPLCGAGPGIDQVIVGSIVPAEDGEGLQVSIELVDGRDRRLLWAGGFRAENERQVTAGLQAIGTEHLPSASRRARIVDDRPRFLGLTQQGWGNVLWMSGVLMTAGGGVLMSESSKVENRLSNHGAYSLRPLSARDALRLGDTYRAQQTAAVVLGAAGITSIIAGVLVLVDAPEKPVSVQFVPTQNSGMLVFSGVFQ